MANVNLFTADLSPIGAELIHSHTSGDRNFYKFDGFHGNGSRIQVMLPEEQMEDVKKLLEEGGVVTVVGELSSHYDVTTHKSARYVYLHYIIKADNSQKRNVVHLTCTVSKLRQEKDATVATVVYKKGGKTTLSILANLQGISEEKLEKLSIGQEIMLIGQYKTSEYKVFSENGEETKQYQEIQVTDLFC